MKNDFSPFCVVFRLADANRDLKTRDQVWRKPKFRQVDLRDMKSIGDGEEKAAIYLIYDVKRLARLVSCMRLFARDGFGFKKTLFQFQTMKNIRIIVWCFVIEGFTLISLSSTFAQEIVAITH